MALNEFLSHMTHSHSNATEYYQDMNYDIVPGLKGKNNTRWMNVGYWKNSYYYNDACEQLALLLSETANFNSNDRVLDLGCGCGEQDFYWAKKYDGISITAMDIVKKQINEANKRKPSFKNSSVNFMVGDASNIPFKSEIFTKVSALDCAYHFKTRKKFLKEAYRVLEYGGVLALTDMLPSKNDTYYLPWQKKWREGIYIPDQNMYDIKKYIKILKKIGFTNIQVKHINHEVFTGLAWYFIFRFLNPKKPINEQKIYIKPNSFNCNIYPKIWGFLFGTSDYVVITAQKK